MGRFVTLCAVVTGAVLLCAPLLPPPAAETAPPQVTEKDLEVAARVFNFVYGMPKGALDVDIVYDPANAASAAEAAQVKRLIGRDSGFGNRLLRARLVPLTQPGSLKARVAYITRGLGQKLSALHQVAKRGGILTFSKDFNCVENSRCVMGMTADPGIRIEISRSAAAASGLEFSQALKLMINEVE